MTQENQGTTVAVPNHNLPAKRKRGRPRKDRSQGPPQAQGQVLITPTPTQGQIPVTPIPAQAQVPITPPPPQGLVNNTPTASQGQVPIPPTPAQGQASIPPFTITETKIHQARKLDIVPDTKNDMVGQAVFGILDGSFEAGYLLTVKVGNTDTVLKGVVFQPGSSVPVSVSNDVAPHVKMLKRANVHMPHNPPTTVYQAVPIVTPQPSQVSPIVTPQQSQVPPIVTHQPFQIRPIASPEPSPVAPIAPPQTFQPQPLNDIGDSQQSVQASTQSNDLLPAHSQSELKHDVPVIQPTVLEIAQAPAVSEASGNEDELPKMQSSFNNNMDIDVASPQQTAGEAVTVPPLDSQKYILEGQGGVRVSTEAASTHGE